MNLQDIRDLVRSTLDVEADELPDELLDQFIRDGYNRAVQAETRWPFFEDSWSVAVVADTAEYVLASDVGILVSVYDTDTEQRLKRLDTSIAEANFGSNTTAGDPLYWTEWGNSITFWPTPISDRTVTLRGYRKPTDWVTSGASTEVDADDRLHLPIAYYALSLAYAQQEDEVLEATYLNRFRESLELARQDIMRTTEYHPIILGGGVFRKSVWY